MENIEICCSHNVGIDGKDFTPECDCSCHQPTEEKWKEEFDKKFLFKSTSYGDPAVEYVNQANIIQDTTELKSFIENLLEQERQRMSDEIEKRKMDGYCKDENCSHDECGTIRWFNKGLNISLSIINK